MDHIAIGGSGSMQSQEKINWCSEMPPENISSLKRAVLLVLLQQTPSSLVAIGLFSSVIHFTIGWYKHTNEEMKVILLW